MSRKTVSRGATATALATLLTLASATPTLAASRPSRERGLSVRTGSWSLVLDLSLRMGGWMFGIDLGRSASGKPTGITEKVGLGLDPNGQEMANDPVYPTPIGVAPVAGGG